ncbi:MAG TPA: hypothetical protein VMW38_12860 [Terriglobia bacterium]|nr:hypothetical protein [Terriglobia bacterium]
MINQSSFDEARRTLLVSAGAGRSLPAAGLLYWLILGIAGFFLKPSSWCLAAFFGSGLLFPLGILLSKPMGSNLFVKNQPLNSLAPKAVLSINLLWPVHFAVFYSAPQVVPLSLAIGMALHWPIIGWMYGSKACLQHAFIRVVSVSAAWALLPQQRYTVVPFIVAVAYLISIIQLRSEVKVANNAFKQTPQSGVA